MCRFALTLLLLLAAKLAAAQANVEIVAVHGSPKELAAKAQLEGLLAKYDLSKWLYTRKINIEAEVIPHSHPVLTLHTRHLDRDDLLLSTFVHEQTHWYVSRHAQRAAAVRELRAIYPSIPLGYPQGSSDADGNYDHLLVIYREYQADRELLGEAGAKAVMDFWADDHYTWLYRKVLEDGPRIEAVMRKHKML